VVQQQTTASVWTYREGIVEPGASPRNVVGYEVEARDGSIGKVDDATYEVGSSCLVIDTGPWIFGKKVLLPAGVVQSVDHENEKIFVDRTKDEIKDAPEFEEALIDDAEYRAKLGSYYGDVGFASNPDR
jgi:hypothetical protein